MKLTFTFTIRMLVIAALVALPIIFLASFVAIEHTSQPHFCTSCHIMQPYYDSWKTSSHKDVSCLECHFPPGVEAFVESKTRAVTQVVQYFTKTYDKPWAEISDKSCLRSGCHSERLLQGKVVFKGVLFDHQTHLTQLRRGKQLRCTSCHSQIVQGSHITVTETTCFLCHFKGLPEGEPISGCPSCHAAPPGTVEIQGVTLNHQEMIAQGVDCQRCHIDVIEGDGAVPRERCTICHAEPGHLERYNDSAFMHKNHVTDHKVECTQCHLEILHESKAFAEPLAINCQTCHPDHHAAQRELYMGLGGKGIQPKPSAMFLARVSCEGCHIGHKGGEIEGFTRVAEPAACMSCHGTSYAHMQDQWVQGMGNLINQLAPFVEAFSVELERAEAADVSNGEARKAVGARYASPLRSLDEARTLYAQAKHNIELIRYGKGVHNIDYANELIASAREDLDKVSRLLGSVHRVPTLELPVGAFEEGCLSCHFGIETHESEFGERTFQHGRHTLTAKLACSVCHADQPKGQPEHGKTLITSTAGCDQCHHRQAVDVTLTALPPARKVTCQTCHASGELPRQVAYQEQAFDHGSHAEQYAIQCSTCHASTVKQDFKVDCVGCHHDETQIAVVAKCETCHSTQTAMYRGTGHNIPSLKMASKTDCASCHRTANETIGVATGARCAICHETGDYAAVMEAWQARTRSALAELEATDAKVAALLKALNMPEARELYQSAKAELDFIQEDASLGVHNPELTDVLLGNVRNRLQECLHLLSQAINEE